MLSKEVKQPDPFLLLAAQPDTVLMVQPLIGLKPHLKWLRSLKPEDLYAEILQEYLLTYDSLTDKIERFDKRIEELACDETYPGKCS